MQDRVSQYPGRVKLTPVSGQENVYDMEWADGATVAGTALNKANLLTDSTATAFGLTSSATPNTVLAKARELITAAQNTANGVNSRLRAVTGSYTGNGTSTKTISVNGTPQALLISFSKGTTEKAFTNAFIRGRSSGGMAFISAGHNVVVGGDVTVSFSASSVTLSGAITNASGYTYTYMTLFV